jgi:hypothetical protein
MRKSRLLAGLVTLALGSAALPAHADNVTVSLSNPGGSRTVYVEKVDGTALTTLDFGTSRSLPFKVRVVDDKFDREPFTVTATMTKLYQTGLGGTPDFAKTPISSAQVSLGSVAGPSALDVKAVVQPLLNTVTTITDPVICHALGLTIAANLNPCTVNLADVAGKVQELTLPQDVLATLPKLPLVPQPVVGGPFTNPQYAIGAAVGDPNATNTAPTSRQVLGGDASPVDLSALDSLVAAISSANLIDPAALLNRLGQTLPLGSLLPAQLTTVVSSTTATAKALSLSNILSQTGTYVSLPSLNVTVPAGADAGDYKGTLVVTAMQ